ncbi:MAG: hypothetical protein E7425_09655 [Ruminococcaceae bacterium]|nr:hypothetical protein [Oscillospiraceae bacterium]
MTTQNIGTPETAVIPEGRYWGERTERLRAQCGADAALAPEVLLSAFGLLKKASARANFTLLPERMGEERCAAIFAAADELIRGRRGEDFPLDMRRPDAEAELNENVNEVIANRGSEMADQPELVRPADLDLSCVPERAFPTAARVGVVLAAGEALRAVGTLTESLRANGDMRAPELARGCEALERALPPLFTLPSVAAESAPEGYDEMVAQELARQTDIPFRMESGGEERGGVTEVSRALEPLAGALGLQMPGEQDGAFAADVCALLTEAKRLRDEAIHAAEVAGEAEHG